MQRTQYGVHPPPAEDNIYEYASPDICMQHTTAQLLQPMFLSEINTVCFNEQVKLAACPSVLGGYLIMGKLRRGWLPAAGCCLGAEYSCVALVAPLHPAPPSCSRCSASSSTVSLAGRPGPVVQRLSTAAPPSWSCGWPTHVCLSFLSMLLLLRPSPTSL